MVVCSEGYASSLAADSLRQLGFARAADLAGGYQAWRRWRDGVAPSRPAETLGLDGRGESLPLRPYARTDRACSLWDVLSAWPASRQGRHALRHRAGGRPVPVEQADREVLAPARLLGRQLAQPFTTG